MKLISLQQQTTILFLEEVGYFTLTTNETGRTFEGTVFYRKNEDEPYLTIVDQMKADPREWNHQAFVTQVAKKMKAGAYDKSEDVRDQIIEDGHFEIVGEEEYEWQWSL